MQQVRIKGLVVTAQYGTLADGTILRTSEAFAAHLVNDAKAAEYITAPTEAPAEAPAEADKPKAKKK